LRGDSHKQVFALKVMEKFEIVKLKQVEHIKNEKQILTALKHPFIVQLYHSPY